MLVPALLISVMSYGQENTQDTTKVKERPKVALYFLEEVGIPIDYIAGTSMGSIVGGMYALGYSSSEILEVINNVDWDRLISNDVERKYISFANKVEKVCMMTPTAFHPSCRRPDTC